MIPLLPMSKWFLCFPCHFESRFSTMAPSAWPKQKQIVLRIRKIRSPVLAKGIRLSPTHARAHTHTHTHKERIREGMGWGHSTATIKRERRGQKKRAEERLRMGSLFLSFSLSLSSPMSYKLVYKNEGETMRKMRTRREKVSDEALEVVPVVVVGLPKLVLLLEGETMLVPLLVEAPTLHSEHNTTIRSLQKSWNMGKKYDACEYNVLCGCGNVCMYLGISYAYVCMYVCMCACNVCMYVLSM